ncbi:signal peptidase [Corynebacterium kutscheri]|uniref:Signal peptidase n=1 Tax=Corynebacterium kutscheri TaxID=35755 RepID=A0A0F6R0I4_9CORY|nr:A24 family peptidase [Corynebacterium kutscheri]AKE41320.1 type IV leader peptidase [Corynebacterium kutscheri]VEH08596.1 signal peptidase [Corynebacterium kutscheri]VEH09642.1 signal peptidase [Corynebacterium kutscheri]VEH79725.1 signal peptidase [Corynebacterium kutscheri]
MAMKILVGIAIILWATSLCVYDFRYRRLPNFLTLPAIIGTTTLALLVDQPQALFGGLLWLGIYFFLALMNLNIGGGDIKLALSLGILVGMVDLMAVFVAIFIASLLAIIELAFYRRQTQYSCAHGPHMIIGALTASLIFIA